MLTMAINVRNGSWSYKNHATRGAVTRLQCVSANAMLMASGDSLSATAYVRIAAIRRPRSHDVHDTGEIVGEHVQCHLGGHARQCFHQEVGCSHPGLDRAEGVLDCLASPTHGLRILVEPPLHSL